MYIGSTVMQNSFSPKLVARAKLIFEKRSGRVVSAEETELYLASLAKLGLLALRVIEIAKSKKNEPDNTHR